MIGSFIIRCRRTLSEKKPADNKWYGANAPLLFCPFSSSTIMTGRLDQTLTKSDFKAYCDAPRHLWARVNNKITQAASDLDQLLSEQGYQVEALGRAYLEQDIIQKHPERRLNWQSTFSDGPFEARVDALLLDPDTGRYDLYEVKSSTACDQEDLVDVAYQAVILDRQVQMGRLYLLHLNKDYIFKGELDPSGLFTAEDISAEVEAIKAEILVAREDALKAAGEVSPEGLAHCLSPGDCPCPEICHPGLPDFSIYDIPRLGAKKKQLLLDANILAARDIPEDFDLNEKQRRVVGRAKTGDPYLDREALQAELGKLTFPLYFLDYETCISAIPLYPGYHPQQQIVFQYSLHRMNEPDTELDHSEYLVVPETDPSLSLVEKLSRDIGPEGSILVWNKSFEMSRNREMAELHPDYAGFLEDLNERIVDLGDVVSKGIYLHPGFKGSWSIKNVLPVMVPELSYEGLPVHKGDQASLAWWRLRFGKTGDDERAALVEAMLRYCELDTTAMVRIYREFRKLA
jgi:Domain of unknown function(DUF2779)